MNLLMRKLVSLLFYSFVVMSFAQSGPLEQAKSQLSQGNFERAEVLALGLINHQEYSFEAHQLLGDIYSAQRQWDKALHYYEVVLEDHPDSAEAHFKYGGALGMKALEVNRFKALTYVDDIKEHFEETVRLDPKHIQGRWALIEFYLQLPGILGGGSEKAEQQVKALTEISKIDGLMAKARMALYHEDAPLAEKYYQEALAASGSLWTYQSLARFYENQERPQEALEVMMSAASVYDEPQIDYQIGKLCVLSKTSFERGIKALSKFIDQYQNNSGVPLEWGYYRLAQLQRLSGKINEAQASIQSALAFRPDFEEALAERTKILKLKGV